MSITGKRATGVPVILLHDTQGMIVTVETKSGETYRGLLDDSEDNWNVTLRDASMIRRDGSTARLPAVFLRGTTINFVVLPPIYPAPPQPAPRPARAAPRADGG